MPAPVTVVRDLGTGDALAVTDPDVGQLRVVVAEPQEAMTKAPGIEHIVFTHRSGRTVGLDWTPEDGATDWDRCLLVAEANGYQHALLVRDEEVRLLTRHPPGQPDDWEDRGPVQAVERLDPEELEDPDARASGSDPSEDE